MGWINRCAVIFTQQLPALTPLLPGPPHQPHGHPLIDNTLKARPARQGVRGPVSHRESAGEETLGRQAWGPALGWRTGGRQVPRAAAPGRKPLHPRHGGGCTPGNMHVVWPSVSGDSHVPVNRVLPARVASPSFLPELSQPWLLGGFGAQTQLSLLLGWPKSSFGFSCNILRKNRIHQDSGNMFL